MTRARDLGIPFEGDTRTYNAITDVPGVTVEALPHDKLIEIMRQYSRIQERYDSPRN